MVNRVLSLVAILFFCGFISFIAINGTNEMYGKKEVQNITYKLPDSWEANVSDKQFRLLELSLIDGGDFSVVLFANIQGLLIKILIDGLINFKLKIQILKQ